jgi:ureidoacrylate peracid hydrolase
VTTPPYEEARYSLTPGRTTLVLIDLQNDFLHPDGWYAKSGVDISHMRRVIEPTQALIQSATEAGVPIVWTRHGFRNETMGAFATMRPFLRDGGLRQSTWGYEIYEEFTVDPGDWLSHKSRLSAFFQTDLELILRGLRTETVVIAGVLTNQCVAATSKDASFRDFQTIVVRECTGTTLPHLHEPALEMMKVGWAEVRGIDDTIAALRESRTAATA